MLLITLLAANTLHAAVRELNTVGGTYPVLEENILAELKEQVMKADQLRDEIRKQISEYQPGSIPQLPRAATDRTFTVDMTYTVEEDIIDGMGRVIYPKGFRFNPLKYVSMPGGLLVIDGDDPRQVEWLTNSPYSRDRRIRLLLSNGHASDLIDRLKRPVFYLTEDIARRLQLAAVPALVIQQELVLQVHEIFLPPDTSRSDADK
jgi:conjugal transfer pilus assembly protein TraW